MQSGEWGKVITIHKERCPVYGYAFYSMCRPDRRAVRSLSTECRFSGMEAPAGIEYGTVSEWRRSPAQPVTLLTGFTRPPLPPARPKPANSDTEACVRCRSGHDKAKP